MAYHGRHRESPDRPGVLSWMRKRPVRSLAVIGVAFDFGRSLALEMQHELHPTVIESFSGNTPRMRAALSNTYCIIFHGLGLDNSEEIARAYYPQTVNRCQTLLVHYSESGFNPVESAKSLSEFFDKHANPDKPVNLVPVGLSAGGIASFETMQALTTMRSDIKLKAVVKDSSPTGSIDTKGPVEGMVVEAGGFAAKTPLRNSLIAKPIQYSGELASRAFRGTDQSKQEPNRFNPDDISYVVNETNWPKYLDMLNTIRDFPNTDRRADFLKGVPFYYLRAQNPENDGVVYVDAAGYNWLNIVGHGNIIDIKGGGHANPAQSPENVRALGDILDAAKLPYIADVEADARELRKFENQIAQKALNTTW